MGRQVDLRFEAERFRRLARHIGTLETRERLLRMADELDRWADEGRDANGTISEPPTTISA